MKKILVLLFFFVTLSPADDIVLKNGTIIRNVQFLHNKLKSDGSTVAEYMFNGQLQSVLESSVLRVYLSPLRNDQSAAFDTLTADQMDTTRNAIRQAAGVAKPYVPPALHVVNDRKFPNVYFLTVTAIGAAFTYDQFARAADIQKSIDAVKKILPSADTGEMDEQKTRATILGVVGAIGSAFSLFYSLQSVEIGTDGSTLTLAVRF